MESTKKHTGRPLFRRSRHIRESIVFVVLRLMFILIFFSALLYFYTSFRMAFYEPRYENLAGGNPFEPSMMPFIIISTLQVLVVIYAFLRWFFNYYTITEDQIIHHRGLFFIRRNYFAIKNIESVTMDQSLMGRVFRYGKLGLYSPTLNQSVILKNIYDPRKYMKIIKDLIPKMNNSQNQTTDGITIMSPQVSTITAS